MIPITHQPKWLLRKFFPLSVNIYYFLIEILQILGTIGSIITILTAAFLFIKWKHTVDVIEQIIVSNPKRLSVTI